MSEMKIEKLTQHAREVLDALPSGRDALRITDQLTAALEAAERQHTPYLDEARRRGAELLADRAEALQDEVTRLTAALEAAEKRANVPWTSGQAVDHISCLHAIQELFAKLSGAESRTKALQIEVARLTECEPHDKVKRLTKRLSRSESRAEALQARVTELEARVEHCADCDSTNVKPIVVGLKCQDCGEHSRTLTEAEALDETVATGKTGEHPSEPSFETLRSMIEHWRGAATAAESRAEALQARVAELEAENRELSRRPTLECARQTESELASAKARVAELESQRAKQEATYRSVCAQHDSELADLRGRVERAEALLKRCADYAPAPYFNDIARDINTHLNGIDAANRKLAEAMRDPEHEVARFGCVKDTGRGR